MRTARMAMLAGALLAADGGAWGSKATPARPAAEHHRPIFLRTGAGEIINPLTGQNATQPYSPLQTCGASKCHDYETIVKGRHFRRGFEAGGDGLDPRRLVVHDPEALRFGGTAEDWATHATRHPGGGVIARVLDADCLLCHSAAYDWEVRKELLERRAFRWAPTAAAGLATVQGERATYNRRLFNEDGRAVLPIVKSPTDRNCIQCHGELDLVRRGFSWNDPANPDVHSLQGMRCVTCHPSGLDHEFGTGGAPMMRGCRDCHAIGYAGARVPAHAPIPPSHLRHLDCRTCHIPSLGRAAAEYFDLTVGEIRWAVVAGATRVGAPHRWSPAYQRKGGRIQPVNAILGVWWGNRDADGKVYPLDARELAAAWKLHGAVVTDDDRDGVPEVNRPEEIAAGLRAVEKVLRGSPRFKAIRPLFVKGERRWELGPGGALVGPTRMEAERTGLSISHNVAPVKEALGAGGCVDCHSREGKFFGRTYLVDPFDSGAKQVREPIYRTLGLDELSYSIFAIYWSLALPWIGVLIIAIFFLLSLHFTRFGPHDFGGRGVEPRPDDSDRMFRFGWFERIVHWLVLITFLFLAFTGLTFSFNGWRWLHLVFGDSITPREWHGWLGYAFGAGILTMLALWWRDGLLRKADLAWVKRAGGYFGSHEPVPAHRFNAGQKLYFWGAMAGGLVLLVTGVILYFAEHLSLNWVFIAATLHNLAGLIGVSAVLAHVYLSTIGNPGTAQAIFAGWVTRRWARLHHPLWYEEVTGKPAIEGGAEKPPPPAERPSDDAAPRR